MRVIRFIAGLAVKRAAYQTLEGRAFERDREERGRLLRRDVDDILNDAWNELDRVLPEAGLHRLARRGNRHNTFLALFTIALYHALVEHDIETNYAMELVGDVVWKIYARFAGVPKLVARLLNRDPQKRLNVMLRIFMIYPFSSPGPPGYECRSWSEADRFCTFWTHCPPQQAVRDYVQRHGDRGELEAFRKSWCSYDWALTYALLDGGFKRSGHYERPHTMSAGDEICDMSWYARPWREPKDRAKPV